MSTATKSKYRFVKIKVHPKIDDLFGWYLAIALGDTDLFFDIHRGQAQSLFLRFGRDPHLYNQTTWKAISSWVEDLYNPIKLSTGLLQTMQRGLLEHGVIYVNPVGGLLYGTVEIVEEFESDRLEFPTSPDPSLKITISRWGNSIHFYLSADKTTLVFSRDKYNTIEEAHSEACRHAVPKNITVRDGGGEFQYNREGD